MAELKWKRNAMLDTWEATEGDHTYVCTRTWSDAAVLLHNDREIRRSGSDLGHEQNKIVAQEHLNMQLKEST
jgi:hypothetical protein